MRSLLDLIPLAAFFIGYYAYDLYVATFALIFSTVLCLLLIYLLEKKIAWFPLIAAVIVALFGGLTIYLQDEIYIKLKPTLVNLLFAAILLIGVYGYKKGLMRHVLHMAFDLTEQGWLTLSARWGFFFLGLAVLNEIVWRNFSTDTWIQFKVIGILGLTLLFAAFQLPLVQRTTKA